MAEYRKELKAETRRINDYLASDTHLRPKPDDHGYKRVKIPWGLPRTFGTFGGLALSLIIVIVHFRL